MRSTVTKKLFPWIITALVLGLSSAWAVEQINLTTQVKGTLPHGNGGTDVASPGSSGNGLRSNGSNWASAQFGFSDLSGSASCGQMPALTGDVTSSAGACGTTLANIPTATPMAGSLLATNIAAPGNPASGKVSLFADSTDLRFHDKNASGVIGTTVVADTGASNNFLTAISAAGAISKARPSCSSLSDSAASCSTDTTAAGNISSGTLSAGRLPALTGNVTSSAGSAATTIAAGVVTEAMQVLAVNTTNDVSTTKHGYAPQAPNDATRYLDGTGAYSVPAGGGSSGNGFAWGGDGSDSVLDFDGTNTFSGIATTTGSAPNFVYTLVRDVWATTLTVESGKTLKTAQSAVFATISVTVNGTLRNNGVVGTTSINRVGGAGGSHGETGTTSISSVTLSYPMPVSGTAGPTGGTGGLGAAGTNGPQGTANAGSAGTASICPLLFTPTAWNGGAGGTSGTTVHAGGTALANGAASTVTARWDVPRTASRAVNMQDGAGNQFTVCSSGGGGAGGGAGGGDGTNAGGNGGGGGGNGGMGGFLVVAAPTITVGGSGVISSNGGNGGDGSVGANGAGGNAGGGGGGAGGGGGSGGVVALIYHTLTNSGTISANAGSGGNGATFGTAAGSGSPGTAGQNGTSGRAGFVFEMQN